MTIPKKKGPEFDGAEKMRDFYYSVIKKPLSEDEKKKLKDVFGKKEKKHKDEQAAIETNKNEMNL